VIALGGIIVKYPKKVPPNDIGRGKKAIDFRREKKSKRKGKASG